jgi:hypothetical protein
MWSDLQGFSCVSILGNSHKRSTSLLAWTWYHCHYLPFTSDLQWRSCCDSIPAPCHHPTLWILQTVTHSGWVWLLCGTQILTFKNFRNVIFMSSDAPSGCWSPPVSVHCALCNVMCISLNYSPPFCTYHSLINKPVHTLSATELPLQLSESSKL